MKRIYLTGKEIIEVLKKSNLPEIIRHLAGEEVDRQKT
ncbi:hypothetical protein ES702_02202 [subsurface metagenome]